MKQYWNGVEVVISPEEQDEFKRFLLAAQAYERTRPLNADEVTQMLITAQINTLDVDDNTALRMTAFYPDWTVGTDYTEAARRPVGYKVQRNGKLWRLRMEHSSQTGWEPENTPSLWEQICETHDGTLEDPIPYDGSMTLESGLYYIQDGVIYRCTVGTGNPVYHPLRELVGVYVEEV